MSKADSPSKTSTEHLAIIQAYEQAWRDFSPQASIPLEFTPKCLYEEVVNMTLYREYLCTLDQIGDNVGLNVY
jgi:hypothetical protein